MACSVRVRGFTKAEMLSLETPSMVQRFHEYLTQDLTSSFAANIDDDGTD